MLDYSSLSGCFRLNTRIYIFTEPVFGYPVDTLWI